MKTIKRRGFQILLAMALCGAVLLSVPTSQPARAGEPIAVLSNGNIVRWTVFPITYRTDNVTAGEKLTQAQFDTQVIGAGFGAWVNVPTANLTVAQGASLGLNVTTAAQFNALTCTDNPVVYDDTGAIVDGIIGAGASDTVLGFAGPCAFNTTTGQIVGGRALMNGKNITTPNDLLGTSIHELGHFLGLGHSQVNLICLTEFINFGPIAAPTCPNNSDNIFGVPTMFPTGFSTVENTGAPQDFAITLAADDFMQISVTYPETVNNPPSQIPFNSVYAVVSGNVLTTDNLSSIQGANVTGRQVDDPTTMTVNESRRCAISGVSGYLYTGNPGLGTFTNETGATLNGGGGAGDGTRNGAQYGLFEVALPGTGAPAAGLPPGCGGATLGMFTGEIEGIDPSFTGGSSVGPLGRGFPGGASEQLGVPGVPAGTIHAPSDSITVAAGMTFPGNDFDGIPGTPPTFDFFDGLGGIPNEVPAVESPRLGNGRFRASISPTSAADPGVADVDVFVFQANANQTVTLEMHAKDLASPSPLDSVIEVVDLAGVRQNFCDIITPNMFTGPCLNDDINPGVDRDSRLRFQSGASGLFFVRVFDFRGDARADFIYELEITGAAPLLPDLTITKTHVGNFTQGQDGTYTITVTNSGFGASPGTTTVTDTLPASLTFVSATGSGWTCNAVGQTVTCTTDFAIPVVGSTAITLVVNPSTNQTVTNNVTVANAADANAGNNSASDPTTVNSPSGSFTFDGGGDGTSWIDSDNWNPQGIPGPNDTANIGGAFAVTIPSGTQTIGSCNVTSTQPLTIAAGATLSVGAGGCSMGGVGGTGGLNLAGTLTGTGTVTVTGTLNWSGGQMTGGGTTTVNSPLNITGTVTLDTRTLTNNGTANMTGGATTALQVLNGAIFNNTATGTFNANSDNGVLDLGGGGTFNNAGLFVRGVSTQTFTFQNIPFNNTGTVNVLTGGLELGSNGTSSGPFTVAMGARLTFSGVTQTLTSNISGAGTVNLASTTLNLNGGSYNITGTTRFGGNGTTNINSGVNLVSVGVVQVDGQTANFSSGETVNATSLSLLGGGTLTGSDAITVSGVFTWTEGTVSGGPGILTANGGLNIGNVSVLLDTRRLNNSGLAAMTAGSTQFSFANGAIFNNTAAGTFNAEGSAGIVNAGGGGTFINAGTFTRATSATNFPVGIAFTNTGTVNANSGTLSFTNSYLQTSVSAITRLNGGSISTTGTLDIGAGTLDAAGGSTITGNVNNTGGTVRPGMSPGTLTITGNYIQGAGGTLVVELAGNGGVAGTDFDRLAVGGTANLAGTLNVTSFGGFTPGGGTSFQIMSFTTRVGDFGTKQNNANAAATMTTTTTATTYTVQFQTAGCDVTSAQSGDWSSTATWVGGVVPTATQNVCVVSNHAVTVSTAVSANSLVVTSTAPFAITGGSLSLAAASSIGAGGFNQSGGTLDGAGSVTITGGFGWTGGTQSGAGTTNANGGFNLSGAANKQLNTGRVLNNAAAATWTGTGNMDSGGGAVFNNLMGASFDIQNDAAWSFNLGGGVPQISNAGTLTKSAGAGTSNLAVPFSNTGTVNANSGTLSLGNGGTHTGPFNVAATLNFAGGTHDLNSPASVSGAGTTTFTSGTVNFNTGSSITTAATLSGGTVNVNTGSTANLPTFTQTGGTLAGTGTVNIAGLFSWSAGAQGAAGTTNANGGFSLSGAANKQLNTGRVLNNAAAATWTGTGNMDSGGGAVFNNLMGASFDIQNDAAWAFSLGGGVPQFNNAGTLTKSAGAGTNNFSVGFSNSGTLNANSGTLSFTNSFTQTAGATTLNGGNIAGGTTFNFAGGTLGGVGTITGNVNNTGAMVNPGLTPGVLNIAGNYTQSGTGALNIELAGSGGVPGTDFDRLAITGTATLGGTLNVLSFSGFMPGANSSFQVMTYASFTGDFATKNGLNIATPPLIGLPQATFYLLSNAVDADMSVTKTDSPDPVTVGQNVTYTITVNNIGPGPASNAMLNDALPASTTFVSLTSPAGWMCATPAVGANGTVTCTIASLAASSPQMFTLVVATTAASAPSISNTATVSAAENDPSVANNTATATTTVNAVADVAVTKTDAPDPIILGAGNLTYTVTVSNNGPNDATGVVLTDTLPAGVTFVSATAPCTQAAGTVTCNLGTIANGANTVITIVITPTAAGTLNNTASATTTATDPNAANNSATATTTVNAQADLSVTKLDAPDPIILGAGNLTYTVTVANAGPSPATSVVLTDTLPAGVTFVSATAPCTQAAGTVTCNLGTIASGANTVITIVITPTAAGNLSNTATVTSAVTDPNAANNSATATTTVNASADLSVTKTDAPDPVLINNNLTYTVTVANAGPSPATSVVLTDTLPAGPTFVSATAPCTQAAGTVTCNLGTIASGANTVITIVITPTAAGNLSNTATVASAVTDPNAANNTATATTTVSAAVPDFSVAVAPNPFNVVSGLSALMTVTVTPSAAGFTNAVTLSCSNLPAIAQCMFNPASVTPNNAAVTSQLLITTQVEGIIPPQFFGSTPAPWMLLYVGMLGITALVLVFTRRRHPRLRYALAMLLLLGTLGFQAACADNNRRTPPGTYSVTVTATSGATVRTTTLTLNVQ